MKKLIVLFVMLLIGCSSVAPNGQKESLYKDKDEEKNELHDVNLIDSAIDFYNRENYEKSFELLNSFSVKDAKVYRYLGLSYRYGRGTEKDIEKSIINFRKAIALDDIESVENLIVVYMEEKKDVINTEKLGKIYFDKSIFVKTVVCYLYLYYEGYEEKRPFALETLRNLSGEGVSSATRVLADYYKYNSDKDNAIKYLEILSSKGEDDASFDLFEIYLYGLYGKKDISKAEYYCSKLKENNEYNDCLNRINSEYESKAGELYTDKKYSEAFLIYRKLINNNYVFDMWSYENIAKMYRYGYGVPKSSWKSFEIYEKLYKEKPYFYAKTLFELCLESNNQGKAKEIMLENLHYDFKFYKKNINRIEEFYGWDLVTFNDESLFLVKDDSIKKRKGIVEFWLKDSPRKDSKKDYSKGMYSLRCADKTMATKYVANYYSDSNSPYTYGVDKLNYAPIIPETIGESLYDEFCR